MFLMLVILPLKSEWKLISVRKQMDSRTDEYMIIRNIPIAAAT